MDPKQALLEGVVLPAAFTLVLAVIAWQPWKRAGSPKGAWGSALGIAIGYAAADFQIRGWHHNLYGLFPKAGGDWHPYIAIGTGLIVATLSINKKIGARLPVSIFLTVIATCLYFRSLLVGDWRDTWPAVAIAAVVGVVIWSCIWAAAHKAQGARIPLMLCAAAVGTALILAQSGFASLAQMSGALAACMGVFVILGWLRPQIPAVTAALPVYILVMLGLLIVGRNYANPWESSNWPIAIAALALASPVITILPPIKAMKPWPGTLIGVVVTLAISAAGLALTQDGFDFSAFR